MWTHATKFEADLGGRQLEGIASQVRIEGRSPLDVLSVQARGLGPGLGPDRPATGRPVQRPGLPREDRRAEERRGYRSTIDVTGADTLAEWMQIKESARRQALVSAGLWPLPERTDLKPQIFGRVERNGYSVERVVIQPIPGFYLAGSLYRPRGEGPFPAMLNPHGHANSGRFHNNDGYSIAGRAANLAMQGYVVFSYDMVDFGDTDQISTRETRNESPHSHFADARHNQLWNVGLFGLQTWNSIRALDFLSSLPDVDPARIGSTGASGGGSQTFILGAIDDRLRYSAPVSMLSHTMHGGCLCENAPGLRVKHGNLDYAAAFAPRPQMIIGATGDWTQDTMEVEGPAVRRVYDLFGKPQEVSFVRTEDGHNYNFGSREAMYQGARVALKGGSFDDWAIKERPTGGLRREDLSVNAAPGYQRPSDRLDEEGVIRYLKDRIQERWEQNIPRTAAELESYRNEFGAAYSTTLQVEAPTDVLAEKTGAYAPEHVASAAAFDVGRSGSGDRVRALSFEPKVPGADASVVVLAHGEGLSAYVEAGEPRGLARELLDSGRRVLIVEPFQTGASRDPEKLRARDPFDRFFTTYNRTLAQERVQDLITAGAFARQHLGASRVALVGAGEVGPLAILAAPHMDAVVADAGGLEALHDQALLAPHVFVPGLRNIGGFEGVALLSGGKKLVIHNTQDHFPADHLSHLYDALGQKDALSISPSALPEKVLASLL